MDVPEPELNPRKDAHMALVRPLLSGVCGSDRNLWHRTAFESLVFDSLKTEGQKYRIFGHEFVGEVVALGSAAASNTELKPGDIVSSESHVFCNQCAYCKSGLYHICSNNLIIGFSTDGAFAELTKIPARLLWPVDPSVIRLEVAALMEPFGNAVHACAVADVAHKSVAVFGVGPIGMFTILISKAMGAQKVLAIDLDPKHLAIAQRLGADEILGLNPVPEDSKQPSVDQKLISEIKRYCDNEGPHVSFEMAGPNSSVTNAIAATRRGGHIILFGIKAGSFVIPQFSDLILHGKTLHGVIGRRLFETWKQTQALLQNKTNGLQQKIFDVILNNGTGTILDFETFDNDQFKDAMSEHAKLLFKMKENRG